ncbi:hypothetical protein JTE90_025223 [Oedothorax gibbosus]|uniref:EGF-like domain-containing protein n=1 Tax=Oedothorax gibbosus TaxID=931172 RepID=A0AAV6TGD7_9ARAC|nr:hypothetical protein JTE90_025223 [Oedothorax gibbosus]
MLNISVDACFKKPCGTSLICNDNGDSTYTCSCKEGFMYNGKRCIKMDKCAMGINCEQLCTNGLCSCAEGFYLNSDNATCSK